MVKRVVSGVFIGTPYTRGSTEWGNFRTMIQEINAQNHNSYTLIDCGECYECGAINNTVRPVEGHGIDYLKSKKEHKGESLCDYCFRKFYEE